MGTIIVLIILAVVAYGIFSNVKSEASRAVDNATAFFAGQHGRCLDCKFCRRDETHQFSDADYFCALSKCAEITESTYMDCMVKPVVKEDDLKELFKLQIWTLSGEQYIRTQLLGKTMTYSEVDQFLKELPLSHPEFIREDARERYSNNA